MLYACRGLGCVLKLIGSSDLVHLLLRKGERTDIAFPGICPCGNYCKIHIFRISDLPIGFFPVVTILWVTHLYWQLGYNWWGARFLIGAVRKYCLVLQILVVSLC